MIKKATKEIKIQGKNGEVYSAYRFEDIVREQSKSKEFREKYHAELTRLSIAKQIRFLREEKKYTQKTIAEKTEMTQSVIARIESGSHSISVDTLGRIANALGKEIKLI
jgi:DNA-binding XRE family transcriptional regulator